MAWYIHQRFHDLNLRPWFHPNVNVQRAGEPTDFDKPFFGSKDVVIRRGDVLHTDVGLCYLRLCTDTQEMGYVARLGESAVPTGLLHALAVGNRWQDHLTGSFELGRTGNEVLAATIAACGHFPMVEKPQVTARHLLDFLGTAPDSPPA